MSWVGRWEIGKFKVALGQRCFECPTVVRVGQEGRLVWDRLAQTFAFLCVPCSRKKYRTDKPQYKDTQFAHVNAL